jgi:heme exporter protein A
VLDEPFTSLDSHGIAIVEGLFSRHVAAGGMLAVTSHHQVQLKGANVTRINLST